MDDFQIKTDPGVETVFSNYPHPVREHMLKLRQLIVETARETEGINMLEQALKWGEPGLHFPMTKPFIKSFIGLFRTFHKNGKCPSEIGTRP